MKNNMLITKKRAISPAITSIILIGVAVSGAITAGTTMLRQNEIASVSTRADLIDVALVSMNVAGKAYFSATMKNSGTTSFDHTSVGFLDDVGNSHIITNNAKLDPGQQWGNYLATEAAVTPGKRYVVYIDATAKSGSHYRWADTVTAR